VYLYDIEDTLAFLLIIPIHPFTTAWTRIMAIRTKCDLIHRFETLPISALTSMKILALTITLLALTTGHAVASTTRHKCFSTQGPLSPYPSVRACTEGVGRLKLLILARINHEIS